jgi:uncharacterized lipoprotein YbaY
MHVVSGRALLRNWDGEPGPATAYIRLLDTTRIDAPSSVIAEVVLLDVRLDRAAKEGIDFRLAVEEIDPRARYEVAAWVDVDRDGVKGKGDYVSTASHPVLTRGFPGEVDVHVRRIG